MTREIIIIIIFLVLTEQDDPYSWKSNKSNSPLFQEIPRPD